LHYYHTCLTLIHGAAYIVFTTTPIEGCRLSSEKGLVIVYTGKGKGKTTAALGMALRAVGHGMKVCMIQFIKGEWYYGELTSANRLEPEFELVAAGKGFVGIIDDDHDIKEHQASAKNALNFSRKKILQKKYDLIILDEINYAINLGLVSSLEVVNLVKQKPADLTLVLTGNHASQEIIEIADLVTEMREIKHPFQAGIRAKKGIDF
jgi:cob(I)alamin adenosyltransferase